MRSFSTWGKTNLASVCGIYYCSEGASNSAQYGAACVIQRPTNAEQVPASPENPQWYSLFWYGFGYFGKRLEKQEHSETKTPQFTLKRRKSRTLSCSGLVGEGGFEPPKSLTADLQSVPFGHSGIPPYSGCCVAVKWSW